MVAVPVASIAWLLSAGGIQAGIEAHTIALLAGGALALFVAFFYVAMLREDPLPILISGIVGSTMAISVGMTCGAIRADHLNRDDHPEVRADFGSALLVHFKNILKFCRMPLYLSFVHVFSGVLTLLFLV